MSELPDEMTYGEAYEPAMAVQTEEEARAYFAALVRRNIRLTGNSDDEATRIERINVGYWSGYHEAATMARIRALYGFGHPIFGTSVPSPERAVAAGKAMVALAEATEHGRVSIEAFGKAFQQASSPAPTPAPETDLG